MNVSVNGSTDFYLSNFEKVIIVGDDGLAGKRFLRGKGIEIH